MLDEAKVSKLSEHIVESWDIDTVLQYAKDQLEEFYHSNPEAFTQEWEEYLEDTDVD